LAAGNWKERQLKEELALGMTIEIWCGLYTQYNLNLIPHCLSFDWYRFLNWSGQSTQIVCYFYFSLFKQYFDNLSFIIMIHSFMNRYGMFQDTDISKEKNSILFKKIFFYSLQAVRMSSHRRRLCFSCLSSEVQPLTPERAGPELQSPRRLRSQTALCWTGGFTLQTGESQVWRGFMSMFVSDMFALSG
jgi:hypothetical protein